MKIRMRALSMFLLLGLSLVGCGEGSEAGPYGPYCYSPYMCSEDACECFDGPKKGEPCCDPEVASCEGGECEVVCQYCE